MQTSQPAIVEVKFLPLLSSQSRDFFRRVKDLNIREYYPEIADAIGQEIVSMQQSLNEGQSFASTQFDINLSQRMLDTFLEHPAALDTLPGREIASCCCQYSSSIASHYRECVGELRVCAESGKCLSTDQLKKIRALEQSAHETDQCMDCLAEKIGNEFSPIDKGSLQDSLKEAKGSFDGLVNGAGAIIADDDQHKKLHQAAESAFQKAKADLPKYYQKSERLQKMYAELQALRQLPNSEEKDVRIKAKSDEINQYKTRLKYERVDQWAEGFQSGFAALELMANIGLAVCPASHPSLRKNIQRAKTAACVGYALANITRAGIMLAVNGLSMGPVGAIVSSVNMLISLRQGNEQDTLLKALGEVSDQIDAIGAEMRKHFQTTCMMFDALDQRAKDRFEALMDGFKGIGHQLRAVHMDVATIQSELRQFAIDMSAQMSAFQQEMAVGLGEVHDQHYQYLRCEAYDFARVMGSGKNDVAVTAEVSRFFSGFYVRATIDSLTDISTGANEILLSRLKVLGADRSVQPLFQYAFPYVHDQLPTSLQAKSVRLPNAIIWVEAVANLIDFSYHMPVFVLTEERERQVEHMLAIGQSYREFIIALKTNPDLFHHLFCQYCDALRTIEDEIVVIANEMAVRDGKGEITTSNIEDYLFDVAADPDKQDFFRARLHEQSTAISRPFLHALNKLEESYYLIVAFVALAFRDEVGLQLSMREGLLSSETLKAYFPLDFASCVSRAKGSVQDLLPPAPPRPTAGTAFGMFGRSCLGNDRFYDDDTIFSLLTHFFYQEESAPVRILRPLPFDGSAIPNALISDRLLQAFQNHRPGYVYFLPLHIHGGESHDKLGHWVGLYVDPTPGNPLVYWMDPFGRQPEDADKIALIAMLNGERLFNGKLVADQLKHQPNQLQKDGENCGPWIIEILIYLREHQHFPAIGEIDIEKKRQVHETFLRQMRGASASASSATTMPPPQAPKKATVEMPPIPLSSQQKTLASGVKRSAVSVYDLVHNQLLFDAHSLHGEILDYVALMRTHQPEAIPSYQLLDEAIANLRDFLLFFQFKQGMIVPYRAQSLRVEEMPMEDAQASQTAPSSQPYWRWMRCMFFSSSAHQQEASVSAKVQQQRR
ncbi:MAG: hypothetical protein A2103_04445 [Gammaproteobacteria bacterium GWF2_41_13]|nr:MAG: hypothetical protein A2103_04445 [Gammaproteobacteria bacterium GWF2_41_13]